jgi:hypothetical protein
LRGLGQAKSVTAKRTKKHQELSITTKACTLIPTLVF